MRISLLLILAGLVAVFPRRRSPTESGTAAFGVESKSWRARRAGADGKRRVLNVEEAVRLWSEHGAVF